LAGRVNGGKISGTILVNGRLRPPSAWQNIIGYVEQDDLMYENLTVYETLRYAAMLRLPQSMSTAEKMERVDEVVRSLSLEKCLHTRIGDSELRGVSGGERKRVSIGVELVTKPRLLFLDEPTSGLDSFTAGKIVQCIRGLAERDQSTVLLTIHQPREHILSLFSKIILLSHGKLVFFGNVQGIRLVFV
jgi:ABC-type multidrug transport system ATPase subunit